MLTLKDLGAKPFPGLSGTQMNICTGTVLIPHKICPVGISWLDDSTDLFELIADEYDIGHVVLYC